MVEQYPDIPSWRCGLAMLYGQLDRLEEARSEFERLAERGFEDLPRDLFWLIGMTLLADGCCALGDRARVAVLYDLLLPYADRTEEAIATVRARPERDDRGAVERLGLLQRERPHTLKA